MVWCAGVTISKERGHVIKYKTQDTRHKLSVHQYKMLIPLFGPKFWPEIRKLGGNLNQSF